MNRRRLDTDARRAQLLELGLNLFGERAYDEVSILDIAERAGISKGLLYHYFGGKRPFYVAVIRVAAGRLVDAVRPREGLSPDESLRAGLAAYLDFVEARSPAYRALMGGGIGTDDEVAAVLESARNQIAETLLVEAGASADRPLFRIAARSWIAACEAACLDWLERQDVDRGALIALLSAQLFSAMRAASLMDPDAGVEIDLTPGALLLGLPLPPPEGD